jgi:hypothetical protein
MLVHNEQHIIGLNISIFLKEANDYFNSIFTIAVMLHHQNSSTTFRNRNYKKLPLPSG